jgi:ribonuclease P protein component
MNFSRETFYKSERLCSLKVIENLFEDGEIFYTPLFKVVWQKSTEPLPFPSKIAFSIPKKKFRLAVIRNLIRRRMREAFRKNKTLLYEPLLALDTQIVFIIIFRGNNIVDYFTIENSMKDVMNKLVIHIAEYDKKLKFS